MHYYTCTSVSFNHIFRRELVSGSAHQLSDYGYGAGGGGGAGGDRDGGWWSTITPLKSVHFFRSNPYSTIQKYKYQYINVEIKV